MPGHIVVKNIWHETQLCLCYLWFNIILFPSLLLYCLCNDKPLGLEERYPHHETTEGHWMRGQRSTVHSRDHSPREERMSSGDLCRPELLKQHGGTIRVLHSDMHY